MIFSIDCLNQTEHVRLYFDNIDFALYKSNGEVIYKPSRNVKNKGLHTPSKYDKSYSEDLKDLLLFVGSQCNYKCKYCPEIPFRSDAHSALHADIDSLKASLHNINLDRIKTIMISGGEPLVYWKAVKQIIPFLSEHCTSLQNFRLVTNGSLLTDEIVDYSIRNGCRVVVSEDGGLSPYRKPRTDRETAELYARFNRWAEKYGTAFALRYALGKHHLDAVALYEYFKQKIPSLARIADQGIIECVMPDNADVVDDLSYFSSLTDSELRLICDSRYESILRRYPELVNTVSRFDVLCNNIVNRRYHADQYTCNNAYYYTMHLTFNGDVLPCMWIPTKDSVIGNIKRVDAISIDNQYISWESRKECYKCPVVGLCRGICAKASNDSVEKTCKLKYADALAQFKAFFKVKHGLDVITILPIDDTPCEASFVFNGHKADYADSKKRVNWSVDKCLSLKIHS